MKSPTAASCMSKMLLIVPFDGLRYPACSKIGSMKFFMAAMLNCSGDIAPLKMFLKPSSTS